MKNIQLLDHYQISIRSKPCPWCKESPRVYTPLHEDTWKWTVECNNSNCNVQPKSKHASFRKTSKKNIHLFLKKLDQLIESWNLNNDYECKHNTKLHLYTLKRQGMCFE